MSENLVPIAKAARIAEVSEGTIRRECALGRLAHVKTIYGKLIDAQDLARYKAERQAARQLVPA